MNLILTILCHMLFVECTKFPTRTPVIIDHDYHFLNFLIGWEIIGSPILF
jgi:hypothetical protein